MTQPLPPSRAKFLEELERLNAAFAGLAPELELTVRDPEFGVEGFVVVWSTLAARGGPLGRVGKGGTRITPTLTREEIGMLARIMTLKNAAAHLPLGGAKSGLRADPNEPGFEKKYRRFVTLVKPILAEHGGCFGGFGFDIGGKPEHALWACDELKSYKSFTGKPMQLGGTDYDREGVAGLGVAVAAQTVCELQGGTLAGKSIAVQGVGAMGAAVIRYSAERGARLQSVADPRLGGSYRLRTDPSAALLSALSTQVCDEARRLLQQEADPVAALDDVLYSETDVLFPCAMQDVLTAANVDRVRARVLVEGANNPCSAEVRSRLHARGVKLVPDFIANPGGIIAAFVELTSSVSPEVNVRDRVNTEQAKRLTIEKISANVAQLWKIVESFGVEPVQAANYLALSRVFGS